ncbi:hypothetical protein EBZ38_03380 [bacterium]|nr:hypothetical protein [bacterium]NDC94004.1 hypothetical protein [bacterium]NDD83309.1 hypothetical protein [bacterium]
MRGGGRQTKGDLLDLLVVAQAVVDVLRFELGLPLEGVSKPKREKAYEDALIFLMRNPKLQRRYNQLLDKKMKWLKEIEDARQ